MAFIKGCGEGIWVHAIFMCRIDGIDCALPAGRVRLLTILENENILWKFLGDPFCVFFFQLRHNDHFVAGVCVGGLCRSVIVQPCNHVCAGAVLIT